jgi:hypothetical protein
MTPPDLHSPWMNSETAAAYLDIAGGARALRDFITAHPDVPRCKLGTGRVWRFHKADLDKWLLRQRVA